MLTAQRNDGHTLCSLPIDPPTATDWLICDNQILCYANDFVDLIYTVHGMYSESRDQTVD